MQSMDLRGLNPAPVTAFNRDGSLDIEANVRIAKWLASFDEVKSLVILGHAGEGTFLTTEERLELIAAYRDAVDIPIIAGITGEGTKVACMRRTPELSVQTRSIPPSPGSVGKPKREAASHGLTAHPPGQR